ncbi:hypothetical protein CRE_20555 [Caenorhabditis remanei]|uniref:Uncharacterized protein n=1 Tax=Caenorhabditis remanei TaxID=31234 RepID=E3NFD4_CAERE|nr:hypothetical protein CRE_20555 [Caenorhabditis remanei]
MSNKPPMKSSIGIALLVLFASAQSVVGVKRNSHDVLDIREKVNKLNKERLELMDLETNKKDDIKTPLYHPLQTKIACGKAMCNDEYLCLLGPKNSPLKKSEIEKGSPGTGCSGGDGSSGLCMGGGGGSGGDGKAVSSASMSIAFLSLALALIMA